MSILEAGSSTHPWLFASLLIVLGLLAGAGCCLVFMWFMGWIRRRQPRPAVRIWRAVFFVLLVPLSLAPAQAAGVDPASEADVNIRLLYFLAFWVGFLGLVLLSLVRRRRYAPQSLNKPGTRHEAREADPPTAEDVRRSQVALRRMKILAIALLIPSAGATVFTVAYKSETPVASTAVVLAIIVGCTAFWQFNRR